MKKLSLLYLLGLAHTSFGMLMQKNVLRRITAYKKISQFHTSTPLNNSFLDFLAYSEASDANSGAKENKTLLHKIIEQNRQNNDLLHKIMEQNKNLNNKIEGMIKPYQNEREYLESLRTTLTTIIHNKKE